MNIDQTFYTAPTVTFDSSSPFTMDSLTETSSLFQLFYFDADSRSNSDLTSTSVAQRNWCIG